MENRSRHQPAPDSYRPTSAHFKKILTATTDGAEKLPYSRFYTIAPGPGSYRVQSDFGVFVADDTMN